MRKLFRKITKKLLLVRLLGNHSLGFAQFLYGIIFNGPSTIQLHTTSECNLACDYCYSKKEKQSVVDWVDVLNQAFALKVGHVDFLGGEPLLDSEIKKYIQLCLDRNKNVTIHTNALLIDEGWIDYFQKFKDRIKVSIKFDLIEELNRAVGEGQKIYDAIVKCIQANVQVQIHSFVHKGNYHKMEELISFARNQSIFLTIERYMVQGVEGIDSRYAISGEQWNQALKVYHKYCEDIMPNAVLAGAMKGNSCSCYIDLLSVNAFGAVLPCPFASDEQKIGDVTKESLKIIWKRYRQASKKVWMKIPAECSGCNLKRFCHGGCKTHVFSEHNCYDAKDPLCCHSRIPLGIYLPPES